MKRRKPDFHQYYQELFAERWPALREAMEAEGPATAFSERLLKPYYLDPASVSAARALGASGNQLVLDLCAAPGGKTLVLASSLGPRGRIVANERSSQRRRRLLMVLDQHLPRELREQIRVTGHDAARWGLYEKGVYDLILLDVPCSSEAHLLRNPQKLAQWSPARPRHLAQQSFAMLLSALEATKPGGRILYSTCALSPQENDQVIRRAQKRRPGLFTVLREPAPPGPVPEETHYGYMIWPDTSGGAGPIYYALLQKNKPSALHKSS